MAEGARACPLGRVHAIQTAFSYHNTDPDNIRNKADIGGGALYDIGCYDVVTARFIFEAEPRRVAALIDRDPVMGIGRLTSGLIDFGEGRHLTFTRGTQTVPYQRVQILGEQGRVEVEIPFNAPPDRPCRLFRDDGSDTAGGGIVTETMPTVDQYALQGDAFSAAVRGDRSAVWPIEDRGADDADHRRALPGRSRGTLGRAAPAGGFARPAKGPVVPAP